MGMRAFNEPALIRKCPSHSLFRMPVQVPEDRIEYFRRCGK